MVIYRCTKLGPLSTLASCRVISCSLALKMQRICAWCIGSGNCPLGFWILFGGSFIPSFFSHCCTLCWSWSSGWKIVGRQTSLSLWKGFEMCHCNVKLVSSRPIQQLATKSIKSSYLPSTSAENPVGSSLPRLPSSKTATLTSLLAKMTWGRLPPWNMQMKSISIQLCVT